MLDLACGTFDLGSDALRLGKATRIHGGDFCLPMMQAGEEKRSKQPISATTADALQLPYADESFDAVIMAYGFRNLDDPKRGLEELFRVLKPGGQIMILEFFQPTKLWPRAYSMAPLAKWCYRWLAACCRVIVPPIPTSITAFRAS